MEIVRAKDRTTTSVAVVIPHLQGDTPFFGLLDDLAEEMESYPALEVLIIDNACEDNSIRRVEADYPWAKVIHLRENQGYAGGCNRGIEATDSEWVLLLNDDVRLEPGFISSLVSMGESDDTLAAVQPKIRSLVNREMFDYAGAAGGLIDHFGYPFALGRIGEVVETDHGQYDTSRLIFWASGTACLWRRKVLQQIGLLDESFFAHMEEIDLAWRAWNYGWRIRSQPAAIVYHQGGATLSMHSKQKMFLNHRNNLLMMYKNMGRGELFVAMFARFFLDQGIGLIEFLKGNSKRWGAVIQGWWAFHKRLLLDQELRRMRHALQHKSLSKHHHVVYRGCILFPYISGVRSVKQLAEHMI